MNQHKTTPVAIVGCGTWGLSTALHLTNAGYTNVTVFDRASEIPSRYSAGYDLNKIVRPEYEDPFYTDLALVSLTLLLVYTPQLTLLRGSHPRLEDTSLWSILPPHRLCRRNFWSSTAKSCHTSPRSFGLDQRAPCIQTVHLAAEQATRLQEPLLAVSRACHWF